MFKTVLIAGAILVLAGCSTTSVGLKYTPAVAVVQMAPAAPPLRVGNFLDERGEPPTWLGAIRGGFGNALKNLESDRPVSELVKTAFADGLRARGAAGDSPAPQVQLVGKIKKFDCNQVMQREAYVEIELAVLDSAGQQRFKRLYRANQLEGSVFSMSQGVFASVDDLRVLLEKTLREVVDQALDDPSLRKALQA